MTTTMMPKKEEEEPSPSPPGNTTGVEMALTDLTPARALPPGVYFNPTKQESLLTYLNRWIAGHAMPDAEGFVIEHDVYAQHPDVLAHKYRPAGSRDAEPSWWFLCRCKLQHTRRRSAATPRCERGVATGGYWKLEQKTEKVECAATRKILGLKRNFGFYLKKHKEDEKPKTWWLMEEYTSAAFPEDGFALADGKRVLPALYRIYVTPRDHEEKEKTKNSTKKKRERDDDDGEDDHDGAPMTADRDRVLVPADYFDAIKALLPQPSVPVVWQEQTQDTHEPPPLPLPGVLNRYQAYDASPGDDHTMNIHETHATPEEGQGNTNDDADSSQQRDLLLVDEGITVWEMGRDDALADSSWMDQHY